MKLVRLNVAFLALNVALFGAAIYFLAHRTATVSEPVPSTETTTAPAAEVVVVTNETVVVSDIRWQQLESEDYKAYIARLRSIGCPEQTIRDIIIADLDKLLAPRVQALKGRRNHLDYWHSEEEELANNVDQTTITRQERAIEKEKRLAIEELLGVDLVRERLKQQGQEDYYERRLGFLPEEKRGPLRELLENYDEQQQAVLQKVAEGDMDGAQEKIELRRLKQQQEAQLAQMLTPEETKLYQLWLSPTANAVRQSMYGMEATEREFLTVYNLRDSFDEAWGREDAINRDPQQYQQANEQLETQLRTQLGDRRYADLKRGEDPEFHHLNAVVTQYQLPRQKAYEVYDLKRTLEAMRSAVQQDGRLTADQKQKAIEEMGQETQRTARGMLGEKAFSAYLRRGQGEWLKN